MGGSKYNRLLGNKFIAKYKYSLKANISSSFVQSNKEKYDYLQNSIIPTYHFQKSLTKLKIPKLEDTINRYLAALKPLLSESEWSRAEQLARKFEANEGKALDKEIRDLDAQDKNGNYISEPWFDMYLKARESIVLNYNPFIAFKPDPNPAQMNQAIRATNMLISSARFLNSLRENKLKPEIFHLNPEKSDTVWFQRLMRLIPESVSFYGAYAFNAYPLDMSQYFRLFNSTRIPVKGKDQLLTDPTRKHICVIHRGHFYVFDVIDKENKLLKPGEIYACILHILKTSGEKEAEHALGVLTSENRDTWADIRARLISLGNKESLDYIDSAFYCIALDDVDTNDEQILSANFLHGNAKNRWFDKNHTLIVNKNGQASVNFEHSWGDGVAVLRFFNEIYEDSTKRAHVTASTKASFDRADLDKYVKRLEFKLDDGVKEAIKRAQQNYNAMTNRVKLINFEMDQYGRNFVKKFQLSPDSLMQAAMQVAYFKLFKRIVATYESASTSAFKFGRTETIRPATLQTNALATHLVKNSSTGADNANHVVSLLRDCTKVHNGLVKEGAMGQGFDRHLFAMRYHQANRRKQPLDEFYNTSEYKLINHNILSTSTLAYPTILTGGFAPVVPDGFGLGYRILDNTLGACVSSYNLTDLKVFVKELENTYDLFYKILKNSTPPGPKTCH